MVWESFGPFKNVSELRLADGYWNIPTVYISAIDDS